MLIGTSDEKEENLDKEKIKGSGGVLEKRFEMEASNKNQEESKAYITDFDQIVAITPQSGEQNFEGSQSTPPKMARKNQIKIKQALLSNIYEKV